MNEKTPSKLPIIEKDSWLEPSEEVISRRHNLYLSRLEEIEKSAGTICDYANAHHYYGFHYDPIKGGWWFREWLPEAIDVFIFGDFTDWRRTELRLNRIGENWEIFLPDSKYKGRIVNGTKYKMYVHGENGFNERIPAYATYVVEDVETHNFTAQVWLEEKPFSWGRDKFSASSIGAPIIYEAHVGMAQEQPRVGSYKKFTKYLIPKIKEMGYNAIQLMAIAEHPYYGSFGYHVSNFYAPSSRFGTPTELKELVKTAHKHGIAVIMDLVHSHYVKNFNEGLNELDGSQHHFSPEGEMGNQQYWDSKNFDYGKMGVEHFLLSNIKYWMDEFHFDGFRFDGVTSMLYHHHGYIDFNDRNDYFGEGVNEGSIRYLALANTLIHALNPAAITIAEDVSGMPTLVSPVEEGGVGFDYRLAMAVPDFWIEYLEDVPDEEWNIWQMWSQMTNRLSYVKSIGYVESHDQAMVGDKTVAFRLMDKEMYWNMCVDSKNIVIDRGIALHKMIRLFTISTSGNGYLTFMGNEFGHPQWVDFPREGNGYSYEFARRQWSLAADENLRYHHLGLFDKAMVDLIRKHKVLESDYPYNLLMDETNKCMVYSSQDLLFVFNWSTESIEDYILPVRTPGKYIIELDCDSKEFGGFGRIKADNEYFSFSEEGDDGEIRHFIKIYNVSRNGLVLRCK